MSTRGKCFYCENTYTQRGMYRHLAACDARQEAIAAAEAEGTPETRLFHLAVKGTYATDQWLHLEVPADATLSDVDQFLRDIWLECCGHLSQFIIDGTNFSVTVDRSWFPDDRSMDVELGRVLVPDLEFSHEYDFGSTTHLDLRVASERRGAPAGDDLIQVMARNEMPDYRCEECDEPATVICVFCNYTLLCDDCVETHECGIDGLLPVVNSPRMGVCGYTGDAW